MNASMSLELEAADPDGDLAVLRDVAATLAALDADLADVEAAIDALARRTAGVAADHASRCLNLVADVVLAMGHRSAGTPADARSDARSRLAEVTWFDARYEPRSGRIGRSEPHAMDFRSWVDDEDDVPDEFLMMMAAATGRVGGVVMRGAERAGDGHRSGSTANNGVDLPIHAAPVRRLTRCAAAVRGVVPLEVPLVLLAGLVLMATALALLG